MFLNSFAILICILENVTNDAAEGSYRRLDNNISMDFSLRGKIMWKFEYIDFFLTYVCLKLMYKHEFKLNCNVFQVLQKEEACLYLQKKHFTIHLLKKHDYKKIHWVNAAKNI